MKYSYFLLLFFNIVLFNGQVYDMGLYKVNKDSLYIYKEDDTFIRLTKEKQLVQKFKNNHIQSYSNWKKTINKKIKIIDSIKVKYSKNIKIGLIDLSLVYPISDFDDYFIYLPEKELLINNQNKSYSLFDALSYKYGSVENLREEINKNNNSLSNITYDNAFFFLKNDYVQYQKLYPEDSVKILDLFIKNISATIPLNNFQKEIILKNKWEDKKRFPESKTIDNYHIYLFRSDITSFLASILNDHDLIKYIEYSIGQNILRRKYNDFLYKDYLANKIDGETFDDYLKKVIKFKSEL